MGPQAAPNPSVGRRSVAPPVPGPVDAGGFDEAKVARLREALARGLFRVDALALARCLVPVEPEASRPRLSLVPRD